MRTCLVSLILLFPVLIQAQVRTEDDTSNVIEWTAARKLNWNDFKANAPHTTREAALSNCGFGYSSNKAYHYEIINITVLARFYSNRSWVRTDRKSVRLLQHEQRHFDLCELYARKFRQKLAKRTWTGDDIDKIDRIYQRYFHELDEQQLKYDKETIHSLDTKKQNEWNDAIARELDELAEFTDK